MACIRCELTRARLTARLLLGLGFDGRHICGKLNADLPGEYFIAYTPENSCMIKRRAPEGVPSFEIAAFNRPLDSGNKT